MRQSKHSWWRKYVTLAAALMLLFCSATWASLCHVEDAKKPEKSMGGSRWALFGRGMYGHVPSARVVFWGCALR